MASLSRSKSGEWRILVVVGDRRPAIRLAAATPIKSARKTWAMVEGLAACKAGGNQPDDALAEWLKDIPDALHEKIVRAGLADTRQPDAIATLGELIERYRATTTVKPSTMLAYEQTFAGLLDKFGKGAPLPNIGTAQVDEWRRSLGEAGISQATISKRIFVARGLFTRAVRWGMLPSNPFGHLRPGPQDNPKRKRFVTRDEIARVLDACSSSSWRCIFALARYAGLRMPSEGLGLRWVDVDWNAGLLTVHSPKTEHHAGHAVRGVPILPELRAVLMRAFEEAEPGSVFVIPHCRDTTRNLRTQAHRIIKSAGLTPWPKTFVNLRGSFATEVAASFPAYVASAWLGHSVEIAERHYTSVRPEDFKRAVSGFGTPTGGADSGAPRAQNPTQRGATPTRTDGKPATKSPEILEVACVGADSRGSAEVNAEEGKGQSGIRTHEQRICNPPH